VADSNVVFTGPATPIGLTNYSPPVQGAGARMMWYPQKAAFRAGFVMSTEWDKNNIGRYSAATGFNTIASGDESIATGSESKATGWYSFATGGSSTASGFASAAIGSYNVASGIFSLATGHINHALDYASAAMGYYNNSKEPILLCHWGSQRYNSNQQPV